MHDYSAYALHIRSAVALPFDPRPGSSAKAPDVVIRFGKTPTALSLPIDRIGKHNPREVVPGAFLLTVAGHARYQVTDGHAVTIEPLGSSSHDIRHFLTGPVLAALLQQRGVILLHASAVAAKDGAILILGKSGSGKSSVAAALVARSYDLLSDDRTGIVLDEDGHPVILPASPAVKLWPDTMDALGLRHGVRGQSDRPKYLTTMGRFRATPLPLCAVFVLESDDRPDIEMTAPGRPDDNLKWVEDHIYRRRFLLGLGQFRTWFRISTAITKSVPVVRVTRPVHPLRLATLADRIEEYIKAQPAAGKAT